MYISSCTYSVAVVLIQDFADDNKHVIYYINKNLIGPPVNYSHEEKLYLDVVFSVQKLHHYILIPTTTVVTNSNSTTFFLSRQIINGKCAH